MYKLVLIIVVAMAVVVPLEAGGDVLASGEYFITQSWSQEESFKRSYHLSVPEQGGQKKLPVFIFLHGNGGNGKRAMGGFIRRHRTLASKYVMVFADGYKASWNIVSERSKADDRGFIEAIVKKIASYDNIQSDNFTIMGSSNGAALVNQMAIETKLPHIRNYITGASPLNTYQHDGKNFKAKGDDNNYKAIAKPMKGKRLMNISGTDDRLVPYKGGTSPGIPAKGGKLSFLDAEQSTYLWAREWGYRGKKLSEPTHTYGSLVVFSYLNGDVIHYKVNNEGHGATGRVGEQRLLQFMEGGDRKKPSENPKR